MNVVELQLKNHLKKHGFSLTEPRVTVFKTLLDQEAQSMAVIVAACQPEVDRATVYRTITLFEKLGIVQRVQLGWKYKLELTDAFNQHHHHLSCLRCGRIIALSEDQTLEDRLLELARLHSFAAQDHQIEIRGLCKQCQAELAASQ